VPIKRHSSRAHFRDSCAQKFKKGGKRKRKERGKREIPVAFPNFDLSFLDLAARGIGITFIKGRGKKEKKRKEVRKNCAHA